MWGRDGRLLGTEGGIGKGRGGVLGDEAAVWWVMGRMGRGRSKCRLEGWVGFVGE